MYAWKSTLLSWMDGKIVTNQSVNTNIPATHQNIERRMSRSVLR